MSLDPIDLVITESAAEAAYRAMMGDVDGALETANRIMTQHDTPRTAGILLLVAARSFVMKTGLYAARKTLVDKGGDPIVALVVSNDDGQCDPDKIPEKYRPIITAYRLITAAANDDKDNGSAILLALTDRNDAAEVYHAMVEILATQSPTAQEP